MPGPTPKTAETIAGITGTRSPDDRSSCGTKPHFRTACRLMLQTLQCTTELKPRTRFNTVRSPPRSSNQPPRTAPFTSGPLQLVAAIRDATILFTPLINGVQFLFFTTPKWQTSSVPLFLRAVHLTGLHVYAAGLSVNVLLCWFVGGVNKFCLIESRRFLVRNKYLPGLDGAEIRCKFDSVMCEAGSLQEYCRLIIIL